MKIPICDFRKISQMSFVEWVKKRVVDIDVETGNSDLSIELLQLALQLGFEVIFFTLVARFNYRSF